MKVKPMITVAALMLGAAAQAQDVKDTQNGLQPKAGSSPSAVQESSAGITVSQPAPAEKPAAAPESAVETVAVTAEAKGQGTIKSGLVSLSLKEVELSNVIRLFATLSDANIIVPALDSGAGQVKIDVNLKDVEWKPALQAILDTHDLELYEKEPGAAVYSVRKKLPPAEAARNTRTFVFKHADIKQASDMIKTMVGDRGQVSSYPQGNAIVVKTTQEIMDDVAQVAERIDTPRQQALIEARIMELSDEGSKERGADLRWDKILSRFTPGDKDGSVGFASVGAPAAFANSGLTGIGTLTLDSEDLGLMIKALQTKGNAQTVSNPKVIVANGETAKIDILQRIPKIKRQIVSTTDSAAGGTTKTVSVVQEEDGTDPDTSRKRYVEYEFGIRLAVTPTIYSEENIAVGITPIISRENPDKTITSFVGTDSDDNKIFDKFYAVDEKRVNTTFMLGNKRTAVIGGLTETKDVDRERKVPLLGDIPLIRQLFIHKYTEKAQTENIIFVTVSLEDGKSFDMDKAVKQSPLTRKQMIRDEDKQAVDDRAVELFKEQSDSRVKDQVSIVERKEQAESHDRSLLAPFRKILRP